MYSVSFSILILLLIKTDGQYNLYYTNPVSETNLYYDCLHYKAFDDIVTGGTINISQSFHQIIPYCIRPLNKTEEYAAEMIRNTIYSNLTFQLLKNQNVTAQDLFSWSASLDLIERYQDYLETPAFISASEIFYNCTFLWFGPYRQYTFDSNEPFNEIVHKTFIAKSDASSNSSIGTTSSSVLNITNLTCYMYLECNRGPPPLCLDWREICDGRMDCLNDGIDEKHCFDLELNECEPNEYRCHDGMCIPEQFINDNPNNPDCLDHTDENDFAGNRLTRLIGYVLCHQNPAFLCEESDPFSSYRGFVCGDGQQIKVVMPNMLKMFDVPELLHCLNGRDLLLFRSVLVNALLSSNLTFNCRIVMTCIMLGKYGIDCIKILCEGQNFPCSIPIQDWCSSISYIMLPVLPTIQGYAQFGYWTNKPIIYESLGQSPWPAFVCYDIQRCPFLPSHFKINNFTCAYISSINSLPNFEFLILYFQTCLSVDETGNKTDCFHPSLFHCSNISKCISKHRLLDGFIDCPDGDDEDYTESCSLNHRHRFRCTSENKCISPVIVHDIDGGCHGGEDEYFSYEQKLPFQNLCNGYTHMSPVLIDGQNETDETNCEQWPCNNPYTQCDRAWTCSKGADEMNCDPTSKCYLNYHECVSPTTFRIVCLPMDQAGDGKVHCLGATDEREYCRRMYPLDYFKRYRCWNDTTCVFPPAGGLDQCPFEQNISVPEEYEEYRRVASVLASPFEDYQLGYFYDPFIKYFILHNMSRFRLNASFTRLIMPHEPSSVPIRHTPGIRAGLFSEFLPKQINLRHAWICNRGIVIFAGIQKNEHCLCPPSYYGNRCQFQNQRVSLTVQFNQECARFCHGVHGIVLTLVDNDQNIHSYEQLTYISTYKCTMKYNLYLLYQFRPKNLTKNYTIRTDAYNKIDLTYYTSWILPVKFLFLPVNRMAAYLIIPASSTGIPNNCPLVCGDHGRCAIYTNTREYFCRCDSGWSSQNCTINHDYCDCSSESVCLGQMNNRSICLCPLNKSGPRCFLHSICQDNQCKNEGQCAPEDDRISMNNFKCICSSRYSGSICDVKDTRIDISFNNVKIPQFLIIHFVTVRQNDDPLLTTIAKKIAFDQDLIVLYTSVLFNLIFVQIDTEFYLAFLQVNASRFAYIELTMKTFHHCPTVQNLFDERTRAFPLLRRVKYYHTLCGKYSQLSCFHDNEVFICLCNEDGYANCFPFDFNITSICSGRTTCENEGQCLLDQATCPTSAMCICPQCFYGGRCQFTTKTFGLSLDAILGYRILPYVKIVQQPVAIKVSIGLTTIMLIVGLINSILSIMTFRLKSLCNVGCGLYLLALSITSFISTLIFTLEFWLLILSQISWMTNRTVLLINCISIEFILRSLLTMTDWFTACIAIERLIVIMKSVNFNQSKSKQVARWMIVSVVLCTLLSLVHDPIHRQLIYDEEEERTWCIVRYSSTMKIFDSMMHILHFFIPFSINLISAILIIIMVARTHSITRKQQTYRQHLRQGFHQQKHLIISPIILVILALPRLIISFLSGCMKSIRDPWLFLVGYFISLIPPLLTFAVFICPSNTYKKEFDKMIKRYQTIVLRRLYR